MAAKAFVRLGRVSFLGILSPRYRDVPRFPFSRLEGDNDGDRARHSLGVASIILCMSCNLGLSKRAQRYAVAWGLTHDLATWPLSHTGEAGFSEITESNSHQLRRAMIEGAKWLPRMFTVLPQLKEMRIEPGELLALFEKHEAGLDIELRILHKLIHSPITPDTLEGMARSGRVFGIAVPQTKEVIAALYRDVFSDVMIDVSWSSQVLQFWRAKRRIYDRHINHSTSIEFESSWSRAIEDTYWRTPLVDSLLLTEREIIDKIVTVGVPRFRDVKKYKHPLSYTTAPELERKKRLRESVRVDDLQELLVKTVRQL
jgi:hypothetical protein